MKQILLLIFCTCSLITQGEILFDKKVQQAYDLTLSLRFKEADKILITVKNDPVSVSYVMLVQQFITCMIQEQKSDLEKLRQQTGQFFENLKEEKNSSYKSYFLSRVKLHQAIAEFKFTEYTSAAFDLRNGYKEMEALSKKDPAFIPAQMSLGTLHALMGAVPENYQWMIHLAGFDGSVLGGLNELYRCLSFFKKDESLACYYNEALIYIVFLQCNVNHDPDALKLLVAELNKADKNNLLVAFSRYKVAEKLGMQYVMYSVLFEIRAAETEPFDYFNNYLKGLNALYKLDTRNASIYLNMYINSFKGSTYKKAALQKLAWCKLIEGDENGYKLFIQKIKSDGNLITDEDKQAQKESEAAIVPNVQLLKSRVLFDGGSYQKALAMLQINNAGELYKSENDKLEMEYRLARIYHKSGAYSNAILHYMNVYEKGKSGKAYFAANSALLLAEIYEQNKQPDKSFEWYSHCLKLRNHEYQNSIDQKAKAGIQRTKDR